LIALSLLATTSRAQTDADDLATRLGLSDLASYRAALSGRPTASVASESDKPPAVSFRELWDHQERWAGHRVQIEGSVVRVFRQDAFGSFPPLVELWLATKAGDLFCTVFPQSGENSAAAKTATEPGAQVTLTGTFLKTIRYAASDQARLAPLVVGNRPPLRIRRVRFADHPDRFALPDWSAQRTLQALVLALLAAAVLAYWHVRPTAAAKRRKAESHAAGDAPLEFIESEDAHGKAGAGR
jgi:hypothetical protein